LDFAIDDDVDRDSVEVGRERDDGAAGGGCSVEAGVEVVGEGVGLLD
jgi:hypothetical protein